MLVSNLPSSPLRSARSNVAGAEGIVAVTRTSAPAIGAPASSTTIPLIRATSVRTGSRPSARLVGEDVGPAPPARVGPPPPLVPPAAPPAAPTSPRRLGGVDFGLSLVITVG